MRKDPFTVRMRLFRLIGGFPERILQKFHRMRSFFRTGMRRPDPIKGTQDASAIRDSECVV